MTGPKVRQRIQVVSILLHEAKLVLGLFCLPLNTITMFTCQATVRKNETACSDVIVPFGLHV